MAKILVIDDEPEIVSLLSEFLASRGYDVCGVSDPRHGAAQVRAFNPDLCLLDFKMPHLTGADLFHQFKAIDSTVEIIYLTAEVETVLAIDLMKAGAMDYLLKPVNLDDLAAAVSRALEHRRLITENIAYRVHLEQLVAEKTNALNEALSSLGIVHAATLDALGLALDFRDQSTGGHSRRVAQLTTGIARGIGICGDALTQIEQGAFLHDIGKLKIPDNILLKPTQLDLSEWTVMQCHPKYGRDFLKKIDFLSGAAEIVYTHHEKFDGSGYPQGLRGEAIPIGARCFAIVDAVDAMVYKRPYNRPISFEEAAAEVQRCAGAHFDPSLVDVALEYLSKNLPEGELKLTSALLLSVQR